MEINYQQLLIDVRKCLIESDLATESKPLFTSFGVSLRFGTKGYALMAPMYDEDTSEQSPDRVLVKFVPDPGQDTALFTEIVLRADPYLIAGVFQGMGDMAYWGEVRIPTVMTDEEN